MRPLIRPSVRTGAPSPRRVEGFKGNENEVDIGPGCGIMSIKRAPLQRSSPQTSRKKLLAVRGPAGRLVRFLDYTAYHPQDDKKANYKTQGFRSPIVFHRHPPFREVT